MDDKLRVVTEGLSEEQKNAVLSLEGPVLIVAGAGSGKTRVLTSRVAALLARGDDPSTVLALTFTKKAAGEMKERIAAMVGAYKAARVVMGTFHSVFIRFLRDYSEVISYPRDFTIYDTTDSVNLVKDCIKTLGLDDKTYKPREVFSRISGAKNALVMPAEYAQRSDIQEADFRTKRPRIAEIYRLYSERCKTYGVMDFDDILLNMNILLRDSPEALEEISSRFNHILVDEYQDTNFAQYVIIRKLAAKHRNICVVGDDSQSIYAFRGAKIENILNFKKDYPECRLFRLERNYRSTRNIVNAANELISHNEGRIPKQCYSEGESGEKIKLLNADSDRSEAMMVTSSILSRLRDEKAQYQDFAILYRTNSQSRAFEEALRRRNVPYRIYSGNAFFDRQEVRELMAYFKLAVNPSDDEAFKRAVMKPRRGVAEQGLAVLSEAAAAASVSILEAIPHLPENVRPATRNSLNSFYRMMHSFIDECATADAYKLCRRIASESGLLALYKEDVSVQGQSRAANIEELMDSVAAFVEEQTSDAEGPALVTLADYLENVSLLSNIDLSEDEGEDVTNMVNLMTVHSAKGLEFPHVYIVGMEENLFPSGASFTTPSEIEEERRLFYVALTRAKKSVEISFAESRLRNGNYESNAPSRFIRELDMDCVANPWELPVRSGGSAMFGSSARTVGAAGFGSSVRSAQTGRPLFQRASAPSFRPSAPASARPVSSSSSSSYPAQPSRQASSPSYPGRPSAPAPSYPGRPSAPASSYSARSSAPVSSYPARPGISRELYENFVPVPMTELYEGERVEHNRFGPGLILQITGEYPELKARVRFDEQGEKLLLLKYAKMRPESASDK